MIDTIAPQSRVQVDVVTYRCEDTESQSCPECSGDVRVETGFNVVMFEDRELQVPAYQMRCLRCYTILAVHVAN